MNKSIAAVLLYMLASNASAQPPVKVNELSIKFPGTGWYQVETAWQPDVPRTVIICTSAMGRECNVSRPGTYKWMHEGETGFIEMGGNPAPEPEGIPQTIISGPVTCTESGGVRSLVNCSIECPSGELLIPTSCYAIVESLEIDVLDPVLVSAAQEISEDHRSAICLLPRHEYTSGSAIVKASGLCVSQ